MILPLDPSSGVPIYRQVIESIRSRVASGRLRAGERLPSVRQLASQLVVNPLTIARAFRELEREGTVETRRGIGTFVAAGLSPQDPAPRRERVRALARSLILEASRLDVAPRRLERIFAEELARDVAGGSRAAAAAGASEGAEGASERAEGASERAEGASEGAAGASEGAEGE